MADKEKLAEIQRRYFKELFNRRKLKRLVERLRREKKEDCEEDSSSDSSDADKTSL